MQPYFLILPDCSCHGFQAAKLTFGLTGCQNFGAWTAFKVSLAWSAACVCGLAWNQSLVLSLLLDLVKNPIYLLIMN